jgi:dual specificity phosphatase 12
MPCPATEIIPGLFVGSHHMITDSHDWLKVQRIDLVISALSDPEYDMYMIEAADFTDGIKWFPIVVDDDSLEPIYLHFDTVHLLIKKALSEGKRVLVHCAAGMSRSVTLVAAYLMIERNLTASDALTLIMRRREIANPNPGFRRQLNLLQRMIGSGSPGRGSPSRSQNRS